MLVNLTPHALTILRDNNGPSLRLGPSGQVARVAVAYIEVGVIDGVPIYEAKFGQIEGLPNPVAGTSYVVSTLVKQAWDAFDRGDLLSPGELVRDSNGQPIGCKGLVR